MVELVMKAKTIIKKTARGYYVIVDNGYGNDLYLTNALDTLVEARAAVYDFKSSKTIEGIEEDTNNV